MGEAVTSAERLGADREWLFVEASSTRFFRIGDLLEAGQKIGRGPNGEVVRIGRDGLVVGVEYDFDQDQVIVVVASPRDGARHAGRQRAGRQLRFAS